MDDDKIRAAAEALPEAAPMRDRGAFCLSINRQADRRGQVTTLLSHDVGVTDLVATPR